jgi:hypothetical protein
MVALFALCVVVSFGVAYKDIKLSAKLMLIFEGVSIVFILVEWGIKSPILLSISQHRFLQP